MINFDSESYIKSPDEWLPIPGSLEAIARLTAAGYVITVATNQSGLGRGLFSEIDLANMHKKMCCLAEESGGRIDGVFFCPHRPEDDCHCRKPRPGLLESIAAEYQVELSGVPYIGDSYKDVELARLTGCQPILVRTGKGTETERFASSGQLAGVPVFDDLAAATDYLLGSQP